MKLKRWLTFAGILNIIIGFLILNISYITLVPALLLILGGFYLKSYFDNTENILKNKEMLLIIGILMLFLNFVSGIITLEVYGLIKKNNFEPIKEKKNKNKKIDILLQLGIILIIISGLMLATSNSINLPNIFKVIGLCILTLIFFGLSAFSKKYLKLESSFKAYYLLGMTFIVLDYIALGYYEFLGPISTTKYSSYFYPILYSLIGLLTLDIKRVLKKDYIYEISVISFLIASVTLFNALEMTHINNLLVTTILLSLMNCLYTTTSCFTASMKKVGYYLSFIVTPINLICLSIQDFGYLSLFLAMITALNLFHLFINKKDNISSVIAPVALLTSSAIVIGKTSQALDITVISLTLMYLIFYLLIKLIKIENYNKIFKYTYQTTFNLAFIIVAIISFFTKEITSIIVTTSLLVSNIILRIKNKEDKIEFWSEPLKSLLFIVSLVIFINSKINVDIILNLFIISILELFLYLIAKNKILKNIHYIFYLIILSIMSLVSTSTNDILLATLALVSSIVPHILTEVEQKAQYLPTLIYSGILTLLISNNIIFNDYYYFNFILLFPLYIILAFFNKNNKIKKNSYLIFSALLPFILLNIAILDYDLSTCLNLLAYIYLGFIINLNINNNNVKDIFFTIYSIIIILMHFTVGGILTGLAIGTITLLMVIIGSLKDFKKIKITGIILFILNLIYQLKDFWDKIPLAIYLLVAGLILIGIVIMKEIKENNQ